MTDFAKIEYQQEIENTRVGGLGGSDAALVLRISNNGLDSLSQTDLKRLAVMLGRRPYQPIAQNAAMKAGHDFEEWIWDYYFEVNRDNWCRECLMPRIFTERFRTFAHADFAHWNKNAVIDKVIECKFSQATTEEVREKYMPQLQWYYMLGVSEVILCHGWGDVEPFKVDKYCIDRIERDNFMIDNLLNGIKILDEALSNGWVPVVCDEVTTDSIPSIVKAAFDDLARISSQKKSLEREEADAKKILAEYMSMTDVSTIRGDGHTLSMTSATTIRSFDSKLFLKEHSDFDVDKYYKTTERKASISYKF